ncbi:MAG: 2Fe-2S iron-sulfur cluster-binding protein [Shimia sp.]
MAKGFHPLTVTAVDRLTPDAVAVTFDTPVGYGHSAGQYLTFRRDFDGVELRRSYSITTPPGGPLQVGIKRVDGGAFSTWANSQLAPGDKIDTMAPLGRFSLPATEGATHLFIAGGSGITPILSLLRTLMEDPNATATLIYANRSAGSIMFREAIEELKNRHMSRLRILHILEQDAQGIPLLEGRLAGDKCKVLFGGVIDLTDIDQTFICGPTPMREVATEALIARGIAADKIRYEVFASAQPGRAKLRPIAQTEATARLEISLDGTRHRLALEPGETILAAALRHGLDAPYSCQAGVCSTCICRITEGKADMIQNHALDDYEVERGHVLSCQAIPQGDRISVIYDDH